MNTQQHNVNLQSLKKLPYSKKFLRVHNFGIKLKFSPENFLEELNSLKLLYDCSITLSSWDAWLKGCYMFSQYGSFEGPFCNRKHNYGTNIDIKVPHTGIIFEW